MTQPPPPLITTVSTQPKQETTPLPLPPKQPQRSSSAGGSNIGITQQQQPPPSSSLPVTTAPLLPITMIPSNLTSTGEINSPRSVTSARRYQSLPPLPSAQQLPHNTTRTATSKVLQVARRPFRGVGRLVSSTAARRQSALLSQIVRPTERQDEETIYRHSQRFGVPSYGALMADEDEDDDDDDEDDDDDDDREGGRRVRKKSKKNKLNGGRAYRGPTEVSLAGGEDHDREDRFRILEDNDDEGRADSNTNWAVYFVERVLRQALLLIGAYMVGVYFPGWYGYVERGLEYASVAWCTCIIILILNYFSRATASLQPPRRGPSNKNMIQAPGGNHHNKETSSMVLGEELQPLLPPATPTHEIEIHAFSQDAPQVNILQDRSMTETPLTPTNSFGIPDDTGLLEMPHPALEPFYVINTVTCERLIPNAEEPFPLDNAYFSGHVMILIRTPNVDDPTQELGSRANHKASQYFAGKQRRFEFQFQLKLKKVPENQQVYFACELEEPIKLGAIQRAFVSAAMAFVKTTNSTFHYSLTGSKDGRSLEKPHMAFTVEGSMDRVVVTPPGEVPPSLGGIIHEDAESIKRRKKGGSIDWNTRDTYTLSLWSSYVDFLEWRCMNLPGIRPFQLSNIIGRQPINLTLYLMSEDRGNDRHFQQDMVSVCNLEMCNAGKMAPGPFTEAWMKRYHRFHENGSLHEQIKSSGSFTNLSGSVDGDKSGDASSVDGANTPARVMPRTISTEELLSTVEEENDYDEDANTVAELGEGIYLRSGDKVVLREVVPPSDDSGGGDDEHYGGFLTNGGGFAVLQGLTASTVIIERPPNRFRPLSNASRRELPARSQLIKSGDTVMFKLLSKGKNGETEVRYLSIHRGWWLKWVNALPTKNGNFTIYTQETEFSSNEDNDEPRLRPNETQTSYLTLGGSFWLRHKRWAKFKVGVAAEESPTFGGRILGLYSTQPSDSLGESRHSDDDEFDFEESEMNVKRKNEWMRPIQFCAYEASSIHTLLPSTKGVPNPHQSLNAMSNSDHSERDHLGSSTRFLFTEKQYRLDVPAWIEMMNRTERRRQLAYVVRVLPAEERRRKNSGDSESPENVSTSEEAFSRLRTGRDLAQIMRVGLSWRRTVDAHTSPDKRLNRRSSRDTFHTPKYLSMPTLNRKVSSEIQTDDQQPPREAVSTPTIRRRLDNLGQSSPHNRKLARKDGHSSLDSIHDDLISSEGSDGNEDNSTDYGDEVGDDADACSVDLPQSRQRRGREIIGKIAKTVKTGTTTVAATGKTVVQQSKKVGLGTVNAGRAIMAPISRGAGAVRSTKPPAAKEPKTINLNPSRRVEKDHVVLVNKAMKQLGRREAREAWLSQPASFLAGVLSPPEQSCRTASNVLFRMSNLPPSSPMYSKFTNILSAQVASTSDLDDWFLQGDAVQLGVVPEKGDKSKGSLVYDCLVARCLWESHWREEWCGVYEGTLSFYAPLTKKPSLELSFMDIEKIRPLDVGSQSPLPGLCLLVVETAWLCHYIAFINLETRDHFKAKIDQAMAEHAESELTKTIGNKDLWKARFWQGFQSSMESSLSSGSAKWAQVLSSNKMMHRTILNGRRMVFDLDQNSLVEQDIDSKIKFAEQLLATSLSFSLDSVQRDPKAFVQFLDATSQLRSLSLDLVDRSSHEAFCLFVNIYHCLLQHSLLVTVNGPLVNRSAAHFMRTTCYEIGGDVFSLAEIHNCIIRGKMPRPVSFKPPYVDVPRKSNAYRYYALEFVDPRIAFVVNTGDMACPQTVPVLQADKLDSQLTTAVQIFVQNELKADVHRRTILLPKVCDVYRNDYSNGEPISWLRFCLKFMTDEHKEKEDLIRSMLEKSDPLPPAVIKYQPNAIQYHTYLKMRDDDLLTWL